MRSERIKKGFIIFILLAVSVLGLAFAETPSVPGEAADKLESIELSERETTEKLFALYSEAEYMKSEIGSMEAAIADIQLDIVAKEKEIDDLVDQFETTKDTLKSVLKTRQRMGMGSFFQMVLESRDLNDLLDRLNLIRDLARNSDILLDNIQVQESAISQEKETLQTLKSGLEIKKYDLEEKLSVLRTSIAELEAFLESLSTEKATYEAYLRSIDEVWKSLKPMFSKTVADLNAIIERAEFPEDTIEVSLSLFSAKGYLNEEKFNQVLASKKILPVMSFEFNKEEAVLTLPEYQLELTGFFILTDPQTVSFNVDSGIFYGLPMSDNAIKDLFIDGSFVFNLKTLLGKNEIKEIIHDNDRLILSIGIKLF